MPRAQRFTVYDAMEAKGLFEANPANQSSSEYKRQDFPKMLYSPTGEMKVIVPAELITTPLGPKFVGEQRELYLFEERAGEEAPYERLLGDAMAALDHAIALHPDHVVALLHRGQLLYQLKRFEASLAAFSQAKERAQIFIPAYVPSLTLAEAQLHFAFGRRTQAAELLSECPDGTRMWLDHPIDALSLKRQLQEA